MQRRAARRLRERELWVTAVLFLAPVLALLALLGGLRLLRHGTLPRLRLAGNSVAGRDAEGVRRAAQAIADDRARLRITAVRPATARTPRTTSSSSAESLGYQLDVDATVRRVMHRGRQANPIAALFDQIRSTFSAIDVKPVERIDRGQFDAWIDLAAKSLSRPPADGDLVFRGTTVTSVAPGPGVTVIKDDLRTKAERAVHGLGPATFEVGTVRVPPRMTVEELDLALAQARVALSGPVRLIYRDRALRFTPQELADVLDAVPQTKGRKTVLRLVVNPDRLQTVAGEELEGIEVQPVDARFALSGGSVQIIPSRNGVGFDLEKAARQLLKAALSADRKATLKGTVLKPDLSTSQAVALRIDQQVSTFTTYYQCCPPRVSNIHRMADLVRGSVVRPGETFSINGLIGERTGANGFVIAPGITNGEIIDQYGGGISQFGTTMFNAIFFGGYQFEEFQHHSYYFTRYPMGRDATISWPSPDLAFKNDSKYGIYIATSYTDTSVTVTFFGHKSLEVEAVTGDPYKLTDPPTQCKENPELPKGSVVVTQEGSQGFDIVVKRVFEYLDGSSKTETFFTHYKPEPRIEERRSCK